MNIKKHIPNTITCCNLVSGCIATSYAFGGAPKMALLWIIIGAVFDFFDGMSARLLHVSSPIGKELWSCSFNHRFFTTFRDGVSGNLRAITFMVTLYCIHHRSLLCPKIGKVQSR